MGSTRRKNQKVVVAMSGGLDSSVAALILKRAGFDLIGVFMKFWKPSEVSWQKFENRCCTSEAEARARKVAKILKIPFYLFDFSKAFKEKVVDYFLKNYQKGLTPNPCVVCNKEIKFGLLLEKAMKIGADFIATGHYARTSLHDRNFRLAKNQQKVKLLRAKDREKDQSYFLWQITQEQLRKVFFPIGNFTREEVKHLAKKFKLPVLKPKKSVEICFIETTVNDFLKKYLTEKPGKIVDKNGNVLGKHEGLWFYTIGQRKGLALGGGPYWVLEKNLKKNILIVTDNERDLLKKELICKNVNWISGLEPKFPLKIKAKIRYRQSLASATLYPIKKNTYKLVFNKPQRAITPGQSVVFYQKEELLGGGIIC